MGQYKKYYVYQHIRLDNNKVFYIGIGTKNNESPHRYDRAKSKQRNVYWDYIVHKTDYKIEILYESNNYEEIQSIEKLLIKQHKNYGNSLCNMTLGGEGLLGFRNKNLIKRVFIYSKEGKFVKEFEAYIDCAKYLKVKRNTISNSIDKDFLIKGFIIKSYKQKKVDCILDRKEKLSKRLSKQIDQFDENGDFIKTWDSTLQAGKALGILSSHIRECANKDKYRHSAGSFVWEYRLITN